MLLEIRCELLLYACLDLALDGGGELHPHYVLDAALLELRHEQLALEFVLP